MTNNTTKALPDYRGFFFFDKLATNTLVFNSLKTAEESALSGNLRKGKESALLVIVTSEFNPLPK